MRENRYIMLHNPFHYFKNLTGYIKNEFNELKEKIDAHPRAKNIIIYSVPPALLASIGFILGYNNPIAQQNLNLSNELTGLSMATFGGTVIGGSIDILINELYNPKL